jgi:hypothetical protein
MTESEDAMRLTAAEEVIVQRLAELQASVERTESLVKSVVQSLKAIEMALAIR